MMTACRYGCAILVFLVVSLTPRSCTDVSEPAVAAEEAKATVVNETVRTPESAGSDAEASEEVHQFGS